MHITFKPETPWKIKLKDHEHNFRVPVKYFATHSY